MENRLEHLGLWTLEERRNRADLLEAFRMYTMFQKKTPTHIIGY